MGAIDDNDTVPPKLAAHFVGATDVGRERDHNEDAFAIAADDGLAVVADGMAGHAAGEVAACIATDAIVDFFRRSLHDDITWPIRMRSDLSGGAERLDAAIRVANHRVFAEARGGDVGQLGMGTTVVAAAIDGLAIAIAHVGDSRCYRWRDGELTQLTRDHSLYEELRAAAPDVMGADPSAFAHKSVITRAVGVADEIAPTVRVERVRPRDRYLLCTDGLSNMVDDDQLRAAIAAPRPLDAILADLIDLANHAGGVDNITAVLIAIGGLGE